MKIKAVHGGLRYGKTKRMEEEAGIFEAEYNIVKKSEDILK